MFSRRKILKGTLSLISTVPFLNFTSSKNSKPSKAIQTALTRSVHHIGIPVKDLNRSIEFYKNFCGGQIQFINDMYGEGLSKGAQVSNAKCRFAMLKIGNTIMELIEYQKPKGKAFDRANNDIGSIHIAFEVADIHSLYKQLEAKGIRFNAPPHTFTATDGAPDVIGATFAYLRDPDNIQLEIFQAAKT